MTGARQLIFVSGGSSGIGRALIETHPHGGARVLNLSRRPVPGAEHIAVDLAAPSGWQRAADCFAAEIAAFRGGEDGELLFLHSAGTLAPIAFAGEGDAAAYQRNVLLNSAAPQILGDAFLRATRSSPARATLLLLGSGAAGTAYEGWSGYCAGKAALEHWTRTVGAELARRRRRGRILCIAPGVVETAMQEEIRATAVADFPEVERFRTLHATGALRSTHAVARGLWALLERWGGEGAVVSELALGAESAA